MLTSRLSFGSSSLLTLLVTVPGGVSYRILPQTLREKYERNGMEVVKDGTELSDLKNNIDSNKDIAGDVVATIVVSSTDDETLKSSNALALKNWCRDKLYKSPYFVRRVEELLVRRLCTIQKKSTSK